MTVVARSRITLPAFRDATAIKGKRLTQQALDAARSARRGEGLTQADSTQQVLSSSHVFGVLLAVLLLLLLFAAAVIGVVPLAPLAISFALWPNAVLSAAAAGPLLAPAPIPPPASRARGWGHMKHTVSVFTTAVIVYH